MTNPTTPPSPQQAVADSVLDELARQWANGTPIVLRYDGEGRPIDGWEFSMPRFRSAVRSALATLAPRAVSEPTADAAVNEGDCSPEERRRFEARISLASGGNADFDREEEWPQSYKNRRTEDMLFGWLAARRDCAVMQVSTVSELPDGVAGDEVVERAAFVAEAKRRGWTPGEFMLGAYAGWLASTLATPTHQAAEPLKPWRDAVEVLLRRPELADRARIEALLAGSLHQAAEPAASEMVLVPREPTVGMMMAFNEGDRYSFKTFGDRYVAMIAAAPSAAHEVKR